MLKNYFKTGLRNILRNKIFSILNISGLILGMICFLFIFLWVQDERSIDNFHQNGQKLFNVYQKVYAEGKVEGSYSTPYRFENDQIALFSDEIKEAVPGIEFVNFYATGYELPWGYPETFTVGDKVHKLEGARGGQNFFKMFNYPIIAGDLNEPLRDISSIAISRNMAELFFINPESAIGKNIRYEHTLDLIVTAVFEDVSSQSSWKFDYLINWGLHARGKVLWGSNNVLTSVKIAETADWKQVERNLNNYFQEQLDQNASVKLEVGLQPFQDLYLKANFENGIPTGGRIEYLKIFIGVAIFILLIACINFTNLSTARAVKRAKEVGVRKVIGSSRAGLIRQFLSESFLIALFALVVSVLLLWLLLPYFNTFTGKEIVLPSNKPFYWLVMAALLLVTSIFSGSYPAFFLASLKPVRILKGTLRFTSSSQWLRKGLTIFQFSLSILLLITTLVVTRQMSYVQNSHLGYDRENLIYVRIEGALSEEKNYLLFKNEASKLSEINLVDRSSEAPHAMGFVVDQDINWEGKGENISLGFKPKSVGFDFLEIMNLKVTEGRGFSRAITTDSSQAFMVNEEAVRQMGMKNPLGKWISAWDKKGRIVGILQDYHTASLHEPIKPVIVDVKENLYFGVIIIRTEPGKTKEAIANLEKVYTTINPNYPFVYQFVDEEYGRLYKSEQVFAKLSKVFAILAIIISCLGLLGLAMFSTEQRLKEISIRKVLGASVGNIVGLFSKDMLRLVAVSFLVTVPIGWLVMDDWLRGFAYHINLSWWIFALPGVVAILVAFFTISSQSLKVAYANPVDFLKNE